MQEFLYLKSFIYLFVVASINLVFPANGRSQANSVSKIHIAPSPLFRDPITDGAADPVIVWNREEKSWWMLYTQRRANVESADVAYCYGTPIGIASSKDNGQTWVYRGNLNLDFDKGINTFWALKLSTRRESVFTGEEKREWLIILLKIFGTGSFIIF